jgi:hypothetical protein
MSGEETYGIWITYLGKNFDFFFENSDDLDILLDATH